MEGEHKNVGEPLMSEEDWSLYWRQVKESKGFDADILKGFHPWEELVIGIIAPVSLEEYGDEFKDFVEFAIKQEGKENRIVLERIVKGNVQVCAPCNYFITFEAKDMDDGGLVKTYQTMVVLLQFPDEDSSIVHIFREKPPAAQVCWWSKAKASYN